MEKISDILLRIASEMEAKEGWTADEMWRWAQELNSTGLHLAMQSGRTKIDIIQKESK